MWRSRRACRRPHGRDRGPLNRSCRPSYVRSTPRRPRRQWAPRRRCRRRSNVFIPLATVTGAPRAGAGVIVSVVGVRPMRPTPRTARRSGSCGCQRTCGLSTLVSNEVSNGAQFRNPCSETLARAKGRFTEVYVRQRDLTCNRSERVMQVRYQLCQRPHYLLFLLRGYFSSVPQAANSPWSVTLHATNVGRNPTLVVAPVVPRSDGAGSDGCLHGPAAHPRCPLWRLGRTDRARRSGWAGLPGGLAGGVRRVGA